MVTIIVEAKNSHTVLPTGDQGELVVYFGPKSAKASW
jgi:hypothetical protein